MSRQNLATIAIVLFFTFFSCRSRPEPSTLQFDNESADSSMVQLQGYEPSQALALTLNKRLGCQQASLISALPKTTLAQSISSIKKSNAVYDSFLSELYHEKNFLAKCNDQKSITDPIAGVKEIFAKVKAKNHGLTIIMHGGFGSHLTLKGAIHDARTLWQELQTNDNSFRVWRMECSNSYAPDDRCSRELLHNIEKQHSLNPSPLPHVYLLWGYSKGGNTLLQALSESEDLRNKTLALITIASPIGGGIAISTLGPYLKKIFESHSLFAKHPLLELINAGAFAMTPQNYRDYENLLTRAQLQEVEQGSKSLLPSERKKYLDTLALKNFDRSKDLIFGNKKIPIMHVASIVDVAQMQPMPILTLENNQFKAKENSYLIDHTQQIALVSSFKDYPLSDSCIALQHAVIPKNNLPSNVHSELLGLLKIDHLRLRLTSEQKTSNLPNNLIVDAIIAATTTRLESGDLR